MSATRRLAFALLAAVSVGTVLHGGQASRQAGPAADDGVPTFSGDVAPILYKNCVSCHRPGEVAPMSLITYRDVRPWAEIFGSGSSRGRCLPGALIRTTASSGTIQPGRQRHRHDREVGGWRRARGKSRRDTGAAEVRRRVADRLARRGVRNADRVSESPASGTVDYQYFEVPTNFTEDKWMQAGEVRAGDSLPRPPHHRLRARAEPVGTRRRAEEITVQRHHGPSGRAYCCYGYRSNNTWRKNIVSNTPSKGRA